MADEKKRRKRVKRTSTTGRTTPKASDRYTPPIPVRVKRGSKLVPIFMFGFFGIGVAVIILNYLPNAPVLPGDSDPWYLLGGLGLICLGFIAATRYQ